MAPDPAQSRFRRDLAALNGIVGRLRSLGYQPDRPEISAWASIIASWPTPDPFERVKVAQRLYSDGMSMRRIASEVGAHERTVAKWLAHEPKRVGRGHRVPDEALELASELIQAGATQYEAAERAGTSQSVLSRRLRQRQAA